MNLSLGGPASAAGASPAARLSVPASPQIPAPAAQPNPLADVRSRRRRWQQSQYARRIRRSGGKAQSADMLSEPHPNGHYVLHIMKPARGTKAMAGGSDNGPLSRLRFPRICVAEVLAVLKPGSNLQRLFQLVVVDIGPADGQLPVDSRGLRVGRQRRLPPPRVGQPIGQVVQRAGQVGVLGGQLVSGPGRPLRVGPGNQQPFSLQPLEALGKDVRGDPGDLAEQVIEPLRPAEQRLDHQ